MNDREILDEALTLASVRFEGNPFMFGAVVFERYFRKKSSEFHRNILECACKFKRLAIAAPRESAKSTVLGFLYPIYCIAFKKKRFMLFLMNTEEKAKGNLGGIKKEVRENRLLSLFGITITKDTETDTIFSHPDGFQTRVLCKGATQMGSVRGERFGAYRPDLAIIDDLEDDEMVRNPDRRRELQEVFDDAVEPAVDRDEGQIIFIGTILHDDSLICKVTSKSFYLEYKKLFYQALNPTTGESLWSEKWTVEQLKQMEKDTPEKFAKEYQNDPVSGSRRSFKKEDWRYWTYNNSVVTLLNVDGGVFTSYDVRDCKAGIGCDLAWEEKRSSDYTVLLPALLTPNDEILVDEFICEKGMKPDRFSDLLFPMVEKYEKLTVGVVEIGFEKAKHEKIMKWLLGKEFKNRKKYLIIKDVKWDTDKITRIITRLQPRYVNHTIYHRSGMGELEYQLMRLPDGTHDDIADALSVVSQILKYPKQKSKTPDYDDEFEWLLKQVKDKKKTRPYVFGGKDMVRDRFPLPCHKSYK